MVKYFATFLTQSAYDWWMSMGQKKVRQNSKFAEVRQIVMRHYVGESDRLEIKKEINKTFQRKEESITTFMPRLLRLIQEIEPNKPEDELIELVKDHLRSAYQEKLTMHTITSLEQLHDLCRKIEAGFAAARHASKREGYDKDKRKSDSTRKPRPTKGEATKGSFAKDITCYRCDRKGHLATHCRSKTKSDGSTLPPRKDKPAASM